MILPRQPGKLGRLDRRPSNYKFLLSIKWGNTKGPGSNLDHGLSAFRDVLNILSLFSRFRVGGLTIGDICIQSCSTLGCFSGRTICTYSGSPTLRKAPRIFSLSVSFLYVTFFSHFLRENLGFILSTSAASARASSSRPDQL